VTDLVLGETYLNALIKMKWKYNGKKEDKEKKNISGVLFYTCYLNYIAELQMVFEVQERVVPVSTQQSPRSSTASRPQG